MAHRRARLTPFGRLLLLTFAGEAEVEEEARRRKVDLLIAPTAESIEVLNESTKGANAVLDVTC